MSASKKIAAKKERWLNRDELNRLTDAWAIWAESSDSPARAIARARLHFFFLLARFGGLRSSEIQAFQEIGAIDLETGLLQLKDRRLFLPPVAIRFLRRILTLPEARKREFLQLDAGFVRRTFYVLGRMACLPPEACAPRALRYARALELLELSMPPQVVAAALGLGSPLQAAQLLNHKEEIQGRPNRLTVILAQMETDFASGRLRFTLPPALVLEGIFSLEELAGIEPAIGKPMEIFLEPGLIFPSLEPLPMANQIRGKLTSFVWGPIEAKIWLRHEAGAEILAMPDAGVMDLPKLEPGIEINAYIPARAIKLQ